MHRHACLPPTLPPPFYLGGGEGGWGGGGGEAGTWEHSSVGEARMRRSYAWVMLSLVAFWPMPKTL